MSKTIVYGAVVYPTVEDAVRADMVTTTYYAERPEHLAHYLDHPEGDRTVITPFAVSDPSPALDQARHNSKVLTA